MPVKIDAYALLQDQKAANTDGGGFTSGAYRTRDLNTEASDADGIVTLSSNQFTLAAGTYLIHARAPAYSVQEHKAKLRNITDSTDALIGSSEHAFSSNETWSEIFGIITIAGTKTFEIQHRCTTTIGTNGFGVRSNFSAIEVYTSVEIFRVVSVTDLRISDLTAITSLDGDEEFVVNDSGASKKITADDISAAIGGGGGGAAQTYVGYDTIGASFEDMVSTRWYAKKITLPTDGLLTSIEAYIKGNAANVGSFGVTLYEDVAGTPGKMLHNQAGWNDTIYLSTTGRWYGLAVGRWLPAGDYWIAVGNEEDVEASTKLAYDTGGSDRYYSASAGWAADWGVYTPTTGSRNYSIRANVIASGIVTGGLFNAYAKLRDEKSATTAGGTATSGSWETRTLNTEVHDPQAIVSLASNQFTLQAGTYLIRARAVARQVGGHRIKIYNTTDAADALLGANAWADTDANNPGTDAVLSGVVTIAATKTFELRHRVTSTKSTDGYGVALNLGTEYYSEVEVFRFGGSVSSGETELDYVEYTGGGITITATTAAGATTLITGNPVTYDGTTRICVEAYSPNVEAASTGGALVAILLYDGSTQVGILGYFGVGDGRTDDNQMLARRFLTPSAGSHTYSIRGYRAVTNGFFGGGAGGDDTLLPAYLRITRA